MIEWLRRTRRQASDLAWRGNWRAVRAAATPWVRRALAGAQAGVPILLKEYAVAAGLGTIGKNALFFSRRYGFNCKLSVVFLGAPVSRYDALPTSTEWKLADCATCRLCVDACPVGA